MAARGASVGPCFGGSRRWSRYARYLVGKRPPEGCPGYSGDPTGRHGAEPFAEPGVRAGTAAAEWSYGGRNRLFRAWANLVARGQRDEFATNACVSDSQCG